MNPDHTVAKITAPLAGDGENAASEHALSTLRNSLIPTTLGPRQRSRRVGDRRHRGLASTSTTLMGVRTPIVFAFVLGMAFLLLLITFHSIVIPIKAILLNLLSVGAAYGILVAIFQWGWGESLLGFHSTGSIANWLPLFLFVVLFGLSMDYHVFILSRVKELVDGGMSTDGRRLGRHQEHRGRRDQRRHRDGRSLRALRHPLGARHQAVRRRRGRRRPARRDRHPRRAPAGDDEAPGRLELVHAQVAAGGCPRCSTRAEPAPADA